jgi:hypothetical protein
MTGSFGSSWHDDGDDAKRHLNIRNADLGNTLFFDRESIQRECHEHDDHILHHERHYW